MEGRRGMGRDIVLGVASCGSADRRSHAHKGRGGGWGSGRRREVRGGGASEMGARGMEGDG